MAKESDLLNEYFNYFDKIFFSRKLTKYPLIYARYKTLKQEYNQLIEEVSPTNFLTTMSLILDLDAQLQIMMDLLECCNYLGENVLMSEEEILQCSSSDYRFYYLEQFGYRLNDKKPHTILHFL
ncbi:hypothetical protein E0F18_03110 [Listeria monocytogenes]|uniref:DUF7006 family protein n=1 Tax=Listeria monocytogenes TaxID=1639 RepID=UPI00103BC49A|nr:hypothetical protein [Listeria monocytogenes]EAF2586299.1 hypothetical protein [Listeria monocytogenes]EAG5589643.1 hypothetical protein [Listeria monocytogenes]MBI1420633.1 hypothetical protein [Listeria monocytogenes]TCD09219.1 hypothetical protein E0F18_03110 [Listeria monocytogenes]HAA0628846.1 hypothetical protein [Listeria monocytogenes]